MYVALAIIIMVVLITFIFKRNNNKGWKLLYTAIGYEDYLKIISKLKSANIHYKLKIPMRGFDSRVEQFNDNKQYEIYVKEEDEYLASKAIHKSLR